MKPADIDRIMATAAANAKKAQSNAGVDRSSPACRPVQGPDAAGAMAGGMAGVQGMAGRRRAGAAARRTRARPERPGGRLAGAVAARRRRPGSRPGRRGRPDPAAGDFGNLSDEDRKKMTELRPEDAGGHSAKSSEKLQPADAGPHGEGRHHLGRGGGAAERGGDSGGGREARRARQCRRSWSRRPRSMMPPCGQRGGYTEEDRKNAKLPLPPEEDSQVQVLLRPGLLADVEIISGEDSQRDPRSGAGGLREERQADSSTCSRRTASSSRAQVTAGQTERIHDGARRRREAGRDRRHGRPDAPTKRQEGKGEKKSQGRRRHGWHAGGGQIDMIGLSTYRS